MFYWINQFDFDLTQLLMSHWLLWSIIRLPLAAHQWLWSCWRLCQGTVRRARWTLASTGVSTRRWCGSHPGWGLWRTVATFPCPRRTSPTWKWVLLEDCGNPIKTNQDFPDVFPLPLNHDGGGEDQSSSMFLSIFLPRCFKDYYVGDLFIQRQRTPFLPILMFQEYL